MEQITVKKCKNKIITIPNILSLIRIFLIPLIIWLYVEKQNYTLSGALVLISAITDIADGYIARTFNMISDVGKVLDPIADKSTQLVVLLLLSSRFPLVFIPVGCLIAKETFMAITGYMIVRKCGVVLGADWFGKLATVVVVLAMILHLLWFNIPYAVSTASLMLSSGVILISLVLYAKRNFKYIIRIQKSAYSNHSG